jgi:hypothetical protein
MEPIDAQACLVYVHRIVSHERIETFHVQSSTLIERKSRMPQIRGIKGEVVVVYCEPLITKEMGCHRLSRRVNKIEIK